MPISILRNYLLVFSTLLKKPLKFVEDHPLELIQTLSKVLAHCHANPQAQFARRIISKSELMKFGVNAAELAADFERIPESLRSALNKCY